MTTLLALAQYHTDIDLAKVAQTYQRKIEKRAKDRARIGCKRANSRHEAWLAELDRLARVKVEAAKLDRENRLRALGSARPIPPCRLRSRAVQNDMDAQAWSWMAFGQPYAGGR